MFEETAREILGNGSLTMCPQDVERLADVLEGNVDMSTMATIDSLTVQRDAAEALARERGAMLDERAWSAQVAEIAADRDAAQQMVAEMRAMLTTGRDIVISETSSRHTKWVEDAHDILETSGSVDHGRAAYESRRQEAVAATIRAEKAEARLHGQVSETLRAFATSNAAERRESELGLQVVAQAARLKLATAVCDALRRAEARAAEGRDGFADYYDATAALAAWDAVPGMEP